MVSPARAASRPARNVVSNGKKSGKKTRCVDGESGAKERWGKEMNIIRKLWWATEPKLGRVANGVASRVDRLKTIGNGQVPIVAARAFLELYEALMNRKEVSK